MVLDAGCLEQFERIDSQLGYRHEDGEGGENQKKKKLYIVMKGVNIFHKNLGTTWRQNGGTK